MKFDIADFDFCVICDEVETKLDLSEILPLQRRRLGICSKMVFNITKKYGKIPMIFSSKYGEINQSFEISKNLAFEDFISPTAFSLSVLNSTLALKAINSQNSSEILALSCDLDIENALILGISKLQNCDFIAIICYDEMINQSYFKEKNFHIAISLIIKKGDENEIEFLPNDQKFAQHSEINFILNDKLNYEICGENLKFSYKFSPKFLEILREKKLQIFGCDYKKFLDEIKKYA